MKSVFLCCLLVLAGAQARSLKQGNMNEYMDAVLAQAQVYIAEHGYDNLPLPDDVASFSDDILGIEFHGSASITNGFLRGLETITRNGDATAELQEGLLVISSALTFADIYAGYDCRAEFMGVGVSADVQIDIENVDFAIKVAVDLTRESESPKIGVSVLDFQITHIGDISVDLDLGPLDWVLSQLVSLVVDILGNTIYNALEGPILEALQDALADIAPPTAAALEAPKFLKNHLL